MARRKQAEPRRRSVAPDDPDKTSPKPHSLVEFALIQCLVSRENVPEHLLGNGEDWHLPFTSLVDHHTVFIYLFGDRSKPSDLWRKYRLWLYPVWEKSGRMHLVVNKGGVV